MSVLPENVSERMRQVVERSIKNVVSGGKTLVKKPVWRNPHYIGMLGNKISVLQGWSAKLDLGYKTPYIDYIENDGETKENERLYGVAFSKAITTL